MYAWDRKHQACITLLQNEVLVADIEHIQNRGQQFKIVEADNKQILVMNIYAPREYSNKKRNSIIISLTSLKTIQA
jgi:hypothetical protein